jgi:cation:H+ antiporter
MTLIFTILLVVASIFLLIKSADYLVNGSSGVARRLHISPIMIGMTIVAFGTSLPELIVSLFSALSGSNDIALGTIIGSNIANITLGIGICAIVARLRIKSKTLIYELPFLLVSTVLLLILSNDRFIFNTDRFLLGRIDGLIFLGLFVIFLYYIYKSMRQDQKSVHKQFKESLEEQNPNWKNILLITGGIVGLFVGGKLFVNSASELAITAGLSEVFVGLTIAALGTSLPELITSIVAAFKGSGDLAIGNLVGSDIFNILFALGITTTISPITINPAVLAVDGMILLAGVLLFLLFATSRKQISKWEGSAMVLMYVCYLSFLIWRL